MTEKKLYLIIQSVLCVLMVILLVASAISIYCEGRALRAEDPMASIYTREKVVEKLRPISPLFFAAVGLTIAGWLLAVKDDNADKPVKDAESTRNLTVARVVQPSEAVKVERSKQKKLFWTGWALFLLCMFPIGIYLLNGKHFPDGDLEAMIASLVMYVFPWIVLGLGCLCISSVLQEKSMAEVVNHITPYENGYAFLNDDEGNIIYHPRMDVTTMEAQPQVPSGLLSNDKFIRYFYDGVEKRAVCLPLSNGMRLVVTVPVQEINAAWHKWITEITIVFAVLLVVFVVLIMTFTGRITRPLQKLTKAAEQISEGNYDTELDYDRQDEVGVLTASFKKLIAELKVYIGNLNDMAYVDALTQIGNRHALRRDYNSYQGHEVTVAMMDMDDFKRINDTHGHEEGDRVLREVGKLLSDTFGKEYCYRYGGDEFLLIVPDISISEFNEKLGTLEPNGPAIDDTARAGFSVGFVRAMLTDSDMLQNLIARADEKMYESKREKNCVS